MKNTVTSLPLLALASILPCDNSRESSCDNSLYRNSASPARFHHYVKPSGTSKRRAKNKSARAARKRNRR